jgi:hypothetical protein
MKKKTSKKKIENLGLKIGFVALLILVIILATIIFIHNSSKEYNGKVDLLVPVIKDNLQSEALINISNLKKDNSSTYVLKITNYNKKDINKYLFGYTIVLDKQSNPVTLKVYKNSNKKNVLDSSLEITNNTLRSNSKQEDIYIIKIKANKNIGKKKYIKLDINGTTIKQ